MCDLGVIEGGAVAVDQGRILETGSTKALSDKYKNVRNVFDADGRLVMPGFVDCHTHLIYAGSRQGELVQRLGGATYLEILEKGGGIHSTVRNTRGATQDELVKTGRKRMDRMFRHGTTTVEIKSGYGLNIETEKKILLAVGQLGTEHPMDVAATFLGAHIIPENIDRNEYINLVVQKMLKECRPYAEFCDVFCEEGAFSVEESEFILSSARNLGYKLKIHSGQFNELGGTGLAAELKAVSADHLEHVSDLEIAAMGKSGTIGVVLPGVPFYLLTEEYPNCRRMIEEGVSLALASDFNPGSCPSFSMQMMIALAVLKCGMTVEEAVCAATINGAWAIDRGSEVGSLETGKKADLLVMGVECLSEIVCGFGGNFVDLVMKDGVVLED